VWARYYVCGVEKGLIEPVTWGFALSWTCIIIAYCAIFVAVNKWMERREGKR